MAILFFLDIFYDEPSFASASTGLVVEQSANPVSGMSMMPQQLQQQQPQLHAPTMQPPLYAPAAQMTLSTSAREPQSLSAFLTDINLAQYESHIRDMGVLEMLDLQDAAREDFAQVRVS